MTKTEIAAPGRSRVVVRPWIMAAVAMMASTEETRYYLRGILVQPHKEGGIVLTATDGHIMAVVHDRFGIAEGKPQIWAYPEHAGIVKAKLATVKDKTWKDSAQLRYEQAGDRFMVGVGFGGSAEDLFNVDFNAPAIEMVADKAAIDGSFPDYTRVIPKMGEERTGISINASLLQRIGKFASAITLERAPAATFEATEPSAPVNVFVENNGEGVSACVVVMPIRAERRFHHPDWLVTHTGRTDLAAPEPTPLPVDRSSVEDGETKVAKAA